MSLDDVIITAAALAVSFFVARPLLRKNGENCHRKNNGNSGKTLPQNSAPVRARPCKSVSNNEGKPT